MNIDMGCVLFGGHLSFAVSWQDVWYREVLGVSRIFYVGCYDSFPNFRLTQLVAKGTDQVKITYFLHSYRI